MRGDARHGSGQHVDDRLALVAQPAHRFPQAGFLAPDGAVVPAAAVIYLEPDVYVDPEDPKPPTEAFILKSSD